MSEVTRDTLAEVLEEIALLLELKGENPFKIRAYRNGAEVVRGFDGDIVQRARDGDLKGIKGIGSALQEKLHELASSGSLAYHQDLKAEFPEGLFEILDLQGLGPKKVKLLYDELGIASLGALKRACQSRKVESLAGFGKKSEEKILAAIETHERFSGRYLLAEVAPDAERILELLRRHPDVSRAGVAGS
ncbi:MAG: histidinol-phosphatase, partial [Akkermansiaceae bacterium]|nr:histidinol-phosphatase [Akkermansiaceae bacterium]